MKNILATVVVVGLAAAGWIYRDKLTGLRAPAVPTSAEASSASAWPSASWSLFAAPVATPHPACEAQAQATAVYPGLTLPNSGLNRKFVELYKQAQASDPALLAEPDWPLQLADRAMISLGGAPMPRRVIAAPIAAARSSKQVVVYTTSHCPYCTKAKQFLTKKGIRYREVDIETSATGKQEYRSLGGNGVPLIMVGKTKVSGFDENELERLL